MTKIFLFLLFPALVFSKPLKVNVSAESAILINADTGQILFEKNAHKRLHPASITKVATAALALKMKPEELDTMIVANQDAVVSISEEAKKKANYSLPPHWLVPGGMHIGIKKGEALSLRDLMHGMMVASGNDAANVIAHFVAGSVPKFMDTLNTYLKELGCENTTLYNPHGLHHPDHQTTAYDMALIAKEALKNPTFRQIVSTVRYKRPKTNMQEPTTLVQTNRLLKKGTHYNPKAIGVKTGYISNAGHTFIGAAEHEGRTLIAVLFKCKDREDIFRDSNKLFEVAFNEKREEKTYMKAGLKKFALDITGGAKPLRTCLEEDLTLSFFSSEEPEVKCHLFWEENLAVPLAKGQMVGQLRLTTVEGKFLKAVPLYANEAVHPCLTHRIKEGFARAKPVMKGIGSMSLIGIASLFLLRRKK
jgi:D-alanyl-D-alanine carboxypeptidase (penicillin-binding protein 5/6)